MSTSDGDDTILLQRRYVGGHVGGRPYQAHDPGDADHEPWHPLRMASYTLNRRAVTHAKALIDTGRYVLDSDWGEIQPSAEDENRYLAAHSWREYAEWHLGLADGANAGTKARHAFVFGDFERIHRTALIACVYRASEWRHKSIELAAHRLLQRLDKVSG